MSRQLDAGVGERAADRDRAHLDAGHPRESTERMQTHTDDRDLSRHLTPSPTGANANVTTSLPSSSVRNGTSASSISMPAARRVGIGLREPRFDLDLAAELDVSHSERHEVLAHRSGVGRRWRRKRLGRPRPQPAAAGQQVLGPSRPTRSGGSESWAGNVTIPQSPQRLPINWGSPAEVKRPSAIGTCAISRSVLVTTATQEMRRGQGAASHRPSRGACS